MSGQCTAVHERARGGRVRRIVQIAVFLAVALFVASHELYVRGIDVPVLRRLTFHSLCPLGGVETLGRYLTDGRFLSKTGVSNFWMLAAALSGTALFGAFFCGWLCPLGAVQDWVGRLGRRLLGRRYNRMVPGRIDRALGLLRYAVLALILYQTAVSASLVFARVDPYFALFNLWTGDATLAAAAVLGAVLAASLLVERPWCRWFCPMGALQGLAGFLAPWTIRRDVTSCTGCGACGRACPMGIDPGGKEAVRDTRCNRCGACLDACPSRGCLELRPVGMRKLRLGVAARAAAAVLLFAVTVAVGAALGDFRGSRGGRAAEKPSDARAAAVEPARDRSGGG